jgi:hypothetical protein
LIEWAKENPSEFYCRIWIRLLPLAVKVDHNVMETYRTEAAIAERAIRMARLEPFLLELEAEREHEQSPTIELE